MDEGCGYSRDVLGSSHGKVPVQGLDGVDGSDDTAQQTNDQDQGAPQQLIPLHLPPSDKSPIE